MALPTLSSHWYNRNRMLEQRIIRQREQEARFRQQWDLHCQYFKQYDVYSSKQAQWSSRQSYQQSMSAYHQKRLKEEKSKSLAQRRERLQKLLQEERDLLEAELRDLNMDETSQKREMKEKSEELKSAREERRKKLANELMHEHWKKNNPYLRQVESDLHKKHVISSWESQITEQKQQEEAEKEEKQHFENEYEIARREAIERMKEEERRRKQKEMECAEILRQQMEELKLREAEDAKLKKDQENLLKQQWELEELEEKRKLAEEQRKKSEFGRFLSRQYKTQLKRRAQQIQEELEMDKQILEALIAKEAEDECLQFAKYEQAVADAAWMKSVIEEQLQLEREREAEVDILFREEAKRVWEKREDEWDKERRARERLMQEVLAGRHLQIREQIEANRKAQEESLKYREELLNELEEVKQRTYREKKEEEELKTARKQELEAQIAEQRCQQWKAQLQEEEDAEAARIAELQMEKKLQLEAKQMTHRGYQDKIHSRPRTAWT